MTDSTQNPQLEQRAVTRSRLLLLSVVLPILIAVAAALLIISWSRSLPAAIAIHWGPDGADGFGSPWEVVAILLGTVGLFSAVLALSIAGLPESGRPRLTHKVSAVTALWLSVTLSIGIALSVSTQRGLGDVALAPDPAPWVLLGAGIGLLPAAAAWFLLPRADRTPPLAHDVAPLQVGPSERAFWTGTVSITRGVACLILGVLVVSAAGAVLAAVNGADSLLASVLPVFLLFAVALTTVRWRVSVGAHGVSVVSFAGWPAIRVKLADIAGARLIEVSPVGDFGGWGWRWAGGRTGIIMQAGPAIEITRSNGTVLVVPVDDAETAVAVVHGVRALQGD